MATSMERLRRQAWSMVAPKQASVAQTRTTGRATAWRADRYERESKSSLWRGEEAVKDRVIREAERVDAVDRGL